MITSEIITYWIQTIDPDTRGRNNTPYMVAMQPGDSWADVTGQAALALAGTPNAVVLRVRCSTATLAAMEADPDIFVLWSVTDGG